MSEAYDRFLALVKARHTCRGFKNDPVPEGAIEKILEAARWAMSGANSQPWEFIVVKNPETIRALYKTYQDEINDLNFWLEQRFPWDLRHPGFRIEGDLDDAVPDHERAGRLVGSAGADRRARRRPAAARVGLRRQHAWPASDAPHRRPVERVDDSASRRGVARTGVAVGVDSHPGTVQADPRRAGAAHAPHDHSGRLSEAAAHRQLPAQAARDRARRTLRARRR